MTGLPIVRGTPQQAATTTTPTLLRMAPQRGGVLLVPFLPCWDNVWIHQMTQEALGLFRRPARTHRAGRVCGKRKWLCHTAFLSFAFEAVQILPSDNPPAVGDRKVRTVDNNLDICPGFNPDPLKDGRPLSFQFLKFPLKKMVWLSGLSICLQTKV